MSSKAPPGHLPARTKASACGIRRHNPSISASASLGDGVVEHVGVFVTRTPRARQAAVSMAS
ncbi:MAG: hypothetical protein U1E40_13025 [Amaricoccus sp.]